MTTNDKSTAETESSAKQHPEHPTYDAQPKDFPQAYMRLRTILDSLEIMALQYCLEDNNNNKRIERALEIEGMVMPVINELQGKITGLPSGECPDGFFNCGGCCVPYHCPDDFSDK